MAAGVEICDWTEDDLVLHDCNGGGHDWIKDNLDLRGCLTEIHDWLEVDLVLLFCRGRDLCLVQR